MAPMQTWQLGKIDDNYICSQGILPVTHTLLPKVAHRFCVSHMYANFRKRFPGKNLKQLMWKATSSTYPQDETFKHLMQIPLR